MHKLFVSFTIVFLLLSGNKLHAQDSRFNQVLKNGSGTISDMVQDKLGVLWMANVGMGLQRYDGKNLKSFLYDPSNTNSIASNNVVCVSVDKDNIVWAGTINSGLQKFDPATNTFTRYRNNPKNASSISSDTIYTILEDHLGNIWVG